VLQLLCNFEKKYEKKHPQKGSFSHFLIFFFSGVEHYGTLSAVQNTVVQSDTKFKRIFNLFIHSEQGDPDP
jgi:hypothetical protein